MIEGSGSVSVSQTNGPGSGRPKNIWILRIRIRSRNTVARCREAAFLPSLCVKSSHKIPFNSLILFLSLLGNFSLMRCLKMSKQWPKGSRRCVGYHQCFGSVAGFDPDSIGSSDTGPDWKPGSPNKGKKLKNSCLKTLNIICRHMWQFFNKKIPITFFLLLYLFKAIIAYRTHCFCLELKDKRPTNGVQIGSHSHIHLKYSFSYVAIPECPVHWYWNVLRQGAGPAGLLLRNPPPPPPLPVILWIILFPLMDQTDWCV